MRATTAGSSSSSSFPITAAYANASQWQVPESNDKEVELLYFRVVKDIIAREGSLLKLRCVIKSMEGYYWRYAFLCLKASDRKYRRAIKDEQLAAKKVQISKMQTEVSVAIAHVRGASVAVLESVLAWRAILAQSKSTKTKQTVSVFWEGENYLHKMARDLKEACECPTLRLWMGFEPNSMMLPPVSVSDAASFDPRGTWEREHYIHYTLWLEKHTVWVGKLDKAQRLEMKRRRGELIKAEQSAAVGGEVNRQALSLTDTSDSDRTHQDLLDELIPGFKQERAQTQKSVQLMLVMKSFAGKFHLAKEAREKEEHHEQRLSFMNSQVLGQGDGAADAAQAVQVTDYEFHIGAGKVVNINGEAVNSWVQIQNMCAKSWSPPLAIVDEVRGVCGRDRERGRGRGRGRGCKVVG